MVLLYYAAVAAGLFLFLHYLLSDFRRAILMGLVFSTFTLTALPWHLVPFDAAAFSCQLGFLLLAFTWFMMRKNRGHAIRLALNGYLLGLLALEFVLLVYLLISQNSGYGTGLVVWLLVKSILPVLALGFMAPFDSTDLRLIRNVIIAGATLTALRLFAVNTGAAPTEELARVTLGIDASPINVARIIGLGASLLIVWLLLTRKENAVRTIALVALVGFLSYAVAVTGSRGPLVTAVLIVPATFVFLGHGSGTRRGIVVALLLGLVLVAGIVLFLPAAVLEHAGIQRVLVYLETIGTNTNDIVRLDLLAAAWDGFLASSGIGVGTGGFEALYGVPGYRYPHNLVLEVAASYGVIGLVVLLLLLFATVRQIVKVSCRREQDINIRPLLALWFYALFNAMVSMDIAGNYALWVLGGLVWLLSPRAAAGTTWATPEAGLGRSG